MPCHTMLLTRQLFDRLWVNPTLHRCHGTVDYGNDDRRAFHSAAEVFSYVVTESTINVRWACGDAEHDQSDPGRDTEGVG